MTDVDDDSASENSAARPKVEEAPPGPADHGGHGGMATREKAPDLAGGDQPTGQSEDDPPGPRG